MGLGLGVLLGVSVRAWARGKVGLRLALPRKPLTCCVKAGASPCSATAADTDEVEASASKPPPPSLE